MGHTRQRLLESACEIFAEQGYQAATVAEICERAEANIAAVNYHFGSKEALYDEVLAYSRRVADTEVPLDGGLPANASSEQRLHAFIHAMLVRTLSEGRVAWFQRMVAHERMKPESGMARKFRPYIQRNRAVLDAIIGEMGGGTLDEEIVHTCGSQVVALCNYWGYNRYARDRFTRKTSGAPDAIAKLARDTTRFARAGIRALIGIDENHNDNTRNNEK